MITFESLSSILGHATVYIEDEDSSARQEFAKTITTLIKQGHAVFLVQGAGTRKIYGYDPENNEWVVGSTVRENPKKEREKIPAENTRITAVSQSSGG